ncbi:uncharacterized protein BDR25DRAFT_350506 [Lindgomyces ingoldianus]|uniref:Uncharacterized protein n=1 Tax=Lindgomyces ingoldianus TaxID=673940 RepID=A0ACB6R7M8_9PLEO|nr:uncharacterized protein BDR25DRAFT_350506 [Lindgomyces ingoldianus]KAF2475097.1 hypothetical protein BDR25DRAFT_350506 [Lindgomyces ingoldianus]
MSLAGQGCKHATGTLIAYQKKSWQNGDKLLLIMKLQVIQYHARRGCRIAYGKLFGKSFEKMVKLSETLEQLLILAQHTLKATFGDSPVHHDSDISVGTLRINYLKIEQPLPSSPPVLWFWLQGTTRDAWPTLGVSEPVLIARKCSRPFFVPAEQHSCIAQASALCLSLFSSPSGYGGFWRKRILFRVIGLTHRFDISSSVPLSFHYSIRAPKVNISHHYAPSSLVQPRPVLNIFNVEPPQMPIFGPSYIVEERPDCAVLKTHGSSLEDASDKKGIAVAQDRGAPVLPNRSIEKYKGQANEQMYPCGVCGIKLRSPCELAFSSMGAEPSNPNPN